MEEVYEVSAKTVAEAYAKANELYGGENKEITCEIVSEPKKGLFGIGSKDAVIKVTVTEELGLDLGKIFTDGLMTESKEDDEREEKRDDGERREHRKDRRHDKKDRRQNQDRGQRERGKDGGSRGAGAPFRRPEGERDRRDRPRCRGKEDPPRKKWIAETRARESGLR